MGKILKKLSFGEVCDRLSEKKNTIILYHSSVDLSNGWTLNVTIIILEKLCYYSLYNFQNVFHVI